jgi:Flp pilus assembly CpaF family ATPase
VSIEARPANTEGSGEFTLADGVYEALRMPGRFVVGETRGPETIPMLKALSSGDDGSLSTIHAMSSADMFQRVRTYARMTPNPFPVDVVAEMVAGAIQFVVYLSWDDGTPFRRRVQSIREVVGVDGNRVISNEIWAPDRLGRAVPHARLTERSERRLAAAGYDLSLRDRTEGWWRR